MAYSAHRKVHRQRAENTSIRLTGLFASKRKGLFVGTARPEELRELAKKMKEAYAAGNGLTFFLWKNDNDSPAYSLTVDVAMEPRATKPVVDDEPEADDDLPF